MKRTALLVALAGVILSSVSFYLYAQSHRPTSEEARKRVYIEYYDVVKKAEKEMGSFPDYEPGETEEEHFAKYARYSEKCDKFSIYQQKKYGITEEEWRGIIEEGAKKDWNKEYKK
jgi:hypothetical protein